VDAPVVGTRKPAEDGTLRVLASGPDEAVRFCRPWFEAMGTVFDGLDGAGQGSRLKLAVNAWVLALNDATAASIALAERFGLDGSLFLDVIDGLPTDSPYAHLKGAAMLSGDAPVSFTVASAAKDAGLIADAARRAPMDSALIGAIHAHLRAVVEDGHGDEDMAAVVRAHRR
jgi:3-hydroxyisobutyrate dehydrogenase